MLNWLLDKTALKHILIWLLIISYFATFNGFDLTIQRSFLFSLLFCTNAIASYYFLNLFVFKKYIQSKFILGLGFIMSAIIFLSIDLLNFKIIFPLLNIKSGRVGISISDFIKMSAVWYSILLTIAFANLSMKTNLIKSKLLAKSIYNRSQLEMDLLKRHFHSHLHLNFFNFCYSKFLKIEKSSAEIVINYSDFLSYNIKNSNLNKIRLADEIEHLNNLLELQSHLSSQIQSKMNIQKTDQQLKIYPMVLSSLLESVYQTIDSMSSEIKVELKTIEKTIDFKITYTIKSTIPHRVTFTSQNEMKHFLNLIYTNYSLQTDNQDNEVIIQLRIDTNEANQA